MQNIIRQALEGWDEAHWAKFRLWTLIDNRDTHCALGRLMEVRTPGSAQRAMAGLDTLADPRFTVEYSANVRVLAQVAQEMFPERTGTWAGTGSVASANNHPNTTFEDMEAWFTKAAMRMDEEILLGV